MRFQSNPRLPGPAACRAIVHYSSQIASPLERLRFLHCCTRPQPDYSGLARRWPFCRRFYRVVLLHFLARASGGPEPRLPWNDRALLWCLRGGRRIGPQGSVLAGTAVLVLWLAAAWGPEHWTAAPRQGTPAALPAMVPEIPSPPVPETVKEEIWLVETEGHDETYSNGLRISKEFRGQTAPRRYPVFRRDAALEGPVAWSQEPRGVVFHSTESELTPLSPANRKLLRERGAALLRYVAREKLYHVVIDRFGRVYRTLPEDHSAYHAGHSLWASGEELYLNLNDSFLGVAFETRLEDAAGSEGLTPAQRDSGRLLVAMLRSRLGLRTSNFVAHEMVSLNPGDLLIGYHTDWRGRFPFKELGLPDNYRLPHPAVAEWGFRYDTHFVQQVGGRVWPGVILGQQAYEREAAGQQLPPEELRRQRRRAFRRLLGRLQSLKLADPAETAGAEAAGKGSAARSAGGERIQAIAPRRGAPLQEELR
jgi:hypothetical protein